MSRKHHHRCHLHKEPLKWLSSIKELRRVLPPNEFHQKKREGSASWTEFLISHCVGGNCPSKDLTPSLIYALADISIEDYLNRKCTELIKTSLYSDTVAAHRGAKKLVEAIFTCRKKPLIKPSIFECDNLELTNPQKNPPAFKGARSRRAFWLYLKYTPNNNSDTDYIASCAFIEGITAISHKQNPTLDDLHHLKELIVQNYAIATPIDLYRYCYLRARMKT